MNYIILDLEFNQAYNFKTGKKTISNPKIPFEIIQIGAVKMNENFEIIEKFNYFIKPNLYKRIHPVVERLTNITEDKLKDKQNFPQVYDEFIKFIGEEEAALCTWGTDDIKSLFRNIMYHQCDHSLLTKDYINVQTYATKFLNFEAGNSIGLKNAVELLEIPQKSEYHDAFNDAYYTAKVFKLVCPDIPEFKHFNIEDIEQKKEQATRVNTKALLAYFEKSLERKLTSEEIAIIKTSYKFGKRGSFEISGSSKKK